MEQNIACGSSLLVGLADDILAIIGKTLSPRDICNLSICCKTLSVLSVFDKIWLNQCEALGVLSSTDLADWRKAVLSYKALFRFLTSVKPLVGIWVHQNPELGNVVYVMPGFASFVGCRVIPQVVGPLGIEGGTILWAPVFEVISDDSGAPTFFLHGKENGQDFVYPGMVKSVEKTCNVLLLEVEPKATDKAQSVMGAFSKLSFEDREKLLETVASGVGIQVPDPTCALLFPCLRGDDNIYREDVAQLSDRREMLNKMHKLGKGYINKADSDEDSSELCDFLRSGDTIGLALQASTMQFDFYQAWPYMEDSVFALYKLPIQVPTADQEYAGLWGGIFGWPLGKQAENKHRKDLFFVVLSYHKESREPRRLTATKILEGTEYVRHPNGSAMFIVNVDQPSSESFPWDSGVLEAFNGEGIGSGYGFRYPGSKPGTLFSLSDGMLAFVWKETRSVLTLQRLDLEELLKKGQRVPPLSPIPNFSYLNRFYTNVFSELEP